MRIALVFIRCMEKKYTARFLLWVMAVILIFLALPGQPVEAVENAFLGYSQLNTDAQREAYALLNTHVGQVTESKVLSKEPSCTYAHYHKAVKPKF